MDVRFLVCADSVALDQRRNTLSLFHVIEEWAIPVFPWVVAHFAIVALFERTANEPNDLELQIVIQLGAQELFRGPLAVRFQERLRMRAITEVGGLVLPSPGLMNVFMTLGDRQLASWSIVVNNIGQPIAQPELPLQ
jgi:Family of unknown function (DUF6941)